MTIILDSGKIIKRLSLTLFNAFMDPSLTILKNVAKFSELKWLANFVDICQKNFNIFFHKICYIRFFKIWLQSISSKNLKNYHKSRNRKHNINKLCCKDSSYHVNNGVNRKIENISQLCNSIICNFEIRIRK